MPSPAFRPAGTPTPGQRSAGNPFSGPTSNSTFSSTGSPPGNQTTPFTTSNQFSNGTNQFGTGTTPGSTGLSTGFVPGAFFPGGPVINYGGGTVLGPDAFNSGLVNGVPGNFENFNPGNTDLSAYGMTNVPNMAGLGTETTNTGSLSGMAAVSTSNYSSTMDSIARIRVRVPPAASVMIEGQYTAPTGFVREFITPRIDPTQEYSYTVQARWAENGQQVVRTRKVNFFAGDRVTVDFLKAAMADESNRHQTRLPAVPGMNQAPTLTGLNDATTATASMTAPPTASFDVAADEGAHDGIVMAVNGMTLSVRSLGGREYEYDVRPSAQITCDNILCSLGAIKPGMRVRVTTKNNQLRTALRVEAIARNLDFVARVR